jgi:hypothetical protein
VVARLRDCLQEGAPPPAAGQLRLAAAITARVVGNLR